MSERILFNDSWRFYNGDLEMLPSPLKGPSYQQAKTERHLGGPASRFYPDKPDDFCDTEEEATLLKWDYVTLPHDYIVNEPYDGNLNNSWGFKKYHPAWYRKHFVIGSEDRDKRIVLYFEGVADYAHVFFNGCDMCHNFQGHTAFEVDVTDFIRFDQDNVLVIRVECGTGEGWWYQGGGIYRNVWLEKYDNVSVDRYGVYIAPVLEGKDGHDAPSEEDTFDVPVAIDVRNDSYDEKNVEVITRILDPEGNEAASVSGSLIVPTREKGQLTLHTEVTGPVRWDIDSPVLYTAETTLKTGGKVTDVYRTRFGFRTIAFDAENGFFINGRNVKLKGVCGHGDYGLTGRAVPDSVYRYKAKLLKDMGVNAYRCSHYPQAEYWMDQMDEKGIVVMAEVRWFKTTPEGMHELNVLMKRDRNHPSVIMWSVGNEEPFFITEQGARIARAMYTEAKKLDALRPIITANDRDPEVATVYQYSDIVGVNYHMELFDRLHEMYPDTPIFSTENSATSTTRGWYLPSAENLGRISAYDHDTNDYFLGRAKTWKFIYDRPWLMGGMQWIAFDHRGEAKWPRVCSGSGAVDMYLLKKDAFYQNQSFWLEKPMIHVLPHWNLPHKTGQKVKVFVYSNCAEVALYLNGELIAKEACDPVLTNEFDVVYAPGKLEAVGYKDGKEAARDAVETSGVPEKLVLRAENADDIVKGDVLLLTCFTVDREGRFVPTASPTVTFVANEAGTVIATGSDNTDHVVPKEPVRRMFAGEIAVAVQTGRADGPLTVTALADGLITGEYTIEL